MTALPLLKKGVIGTLLLLSWTAVTCAQTFVFDFTSDTQSGVYTDLTGSNPIQNWDTSDNPLDGIKNGSLFFDLEPSSGLVEALFGSGAALNWISTGLGDGGDGFSGSGEFISISFARDVRIDQLDFKSFARSGDESSADRVDVYRGDGLGGESLFAQFAGTSSSEAGVRDLGLSLVAGEAMNLKYVAGEFFLEGMTVSAVPEPSSFLLGALALGGAVLGMRRRQRRRLEA